MTRYKEKDPPSALLKEGNGSEKEKPVSLASPMQAGSPRNEARDEEIP